MNNDWIVTARPGLADLPDWRQQELDEWRELAADMPTKWLREVFERHRAAALAGDEYALSDDALGVLADELARRAETTS